jgi:hypothetical protein
MTTQEFKLTPRAGDLMDIYRNDFHFKLFSAQNYTNLAFIGLLALVIPLAMLGTRYDKGCYFLVLVGIGGLGYYSINILSAYWKVKQKEKTVKDWIKSIAPYKSHRVSVQESGLMYYRDNETFMYRYDQMVEMYHTGEYFYCKLTGGMDLVLPAKSFDIGAYELFATLVDEMKN